MSKPERREAVVSQQEYNEHYDKTAGKRLCWSGDGNKQHTEQVRVDGEWIAVDSLWCFDCKAADELDVSDYPPYWTG